MDSSLDKIEFLVGSSNRVEVLDAVSESPRTPHELREETGASRMTVNRVLDDLEDRGWIVRENGRCEPTHRGAIVADEFGRFLSNLSAVEELGEALQWLPTEAFDFDLARLQDATVIHTSSWEDHTGAVRHVADLAHDATDIWGTATGISPAVADAVRETTVEGDTRFDVVMTEAGIDMVRRDATLADRLRDVIASDNATVRRYTGDPPLHMVVGFDETVAVCGHVDDGPPPATLESTDERVRAWARSYYECARDDARPIEAGTFADDRHERG